MISPNLGIVNLFSQIILKNQQIFSISPVIRQKGRIAFAMRSFFLCYGKLSGGISGKTESSLLGQCTGECTAIGGIQILIQGHRPQ